MTQFAVKDAAAAQQDGAARLTRYFWPVAAALLLLRLLLDAHCNLTPDEAFYWTWTRHVSTGYFDHPPMIAWLIWLSTRVFGNTELGVRFPASFLSIASLAIIYRMACRLLHDARAVGFVVLMWIVGPLLPVLGTIITPDAPATFFSVCALAFAVRLAERDDAADPSASLRWNDGAALWIAFGFFCGLALLSKYTTVLLPAGVVLAFVFSRRGILHFARPWIYLSGIIALAVFSPCIDWNHRHQWASFAFQLNHGAGGGLTAGVSGWFRRSLVRAGGLAEFVGGQALVWTPILFGVAISVIAVNWRTYRKIRNADRVLLWSGTLPLLFFGVMATRSHGEINWPAFAYFPLSLLIGRFLTENWQGVRVQYTLIGCKVALGITLVLHAIAAYPVQSWLMTRRVHLTHQITDLYGWDHFGRLLAGEAGGLPVVCNRHQDAGEAAFYLPGQPDVWCDGVGSRTTAFDFFDAGRPDLAHLSAVAFVGGHVDLFNRKWGFHTVEVHSVRMGGGRKNRSHTVTLVAR